MNGLRYVARSTFQAILVMLIRNSDTRKITTLYGVELLGPVEEPTAHIAHKRQTFWSEARRYLDFGVELDDHYWNWSRRMQVKVITIGDRLLWRSFSRDGQCHSVTLNTDEWWRWHYHNLPSFFFCDVARGQRKLVRHKYHPIRPAGASLSFPNRAFHHFHNIYTLANICSWYWQPNQTRRTLLGKTMLTFSRIVTENSRNICMTFRLIRISFLGIWIFYPNKFIRT